MCKSKVIDIRFMRKLEGKKCTEIVVYINIVYLHNVIHFLSGKILFGQYLSGVIFMFVIWF